MFYSIFGAGAGATSRYGSESGSGSDQKMRLLAAPAPQRMSLFKCTIETYEPLKNKIIEKWMHCDQDS
jgi:hypothetical protein